jgi:CRISPR-associated endonuclease/helicase Cas3
VAVHDYGKWDIRFQLKALHALQHLYPAFTPDMADPDAKYLHGPQGYAWFMWEESCRLGLSDEHRSCWQPWLKAVTGHHGRLPDNAEVVDPLADPAIIERDRTARLEWLDAIEALFLHPVGLHLEALPPPCPDLLAGFCAVCDWLGSNDRRFFYETKVYPLVDYWWSAREHARTALGESGLHGSIMGAGGMRQLFPELTPRQLQTLVDTLPLQSGLTIVEAPTGSDKTELALAYASKLLAAGIAESIIFALPTQATNAMLQRLEEVASRFFTGDANVVLAHGKDRYNPNFQALRQAALRPTVRIDKDEPDASVQCVQWLGASRKRAFLGQIGVYTVDQVLLSILPVRHQFVRAFGLRKSVLIIDEVHTYNAYMYGLLRRVLQGQQQAGGSAMLLSATLPLVQKSALVEAWGKQLEESKVAEQIPYPLIARVSSMFPAHVGMNLEEGLLVTMIQRANAKGRAPYEEVSGGPFTITNLGAYGIDVFTPVITPHRSASWEWAE